MLYGHKQVGNQYLVKDLEELGFRQSRVDECVFYKASMINVLYTDDSILAGPDRKKIEKTIAGMKKKFDMTEEGDLSDFLGIHIQQNDDGTYHLTQPHLIDQMMEECPLHNQRPLRWRLRLFCPNSLDFCNSFHYRSVIGKLNYLEKGSLPDILYAFHQCARFSSAPKKDHGDAVRRVVRYLKATRQRDDLPARSNQIY
jgi:Reverse transcriptase (RNA-dependent DNA polymerase)